MPAKAEPGGLAQQGRGTKGHQRPEGPSPRASGGSVALGHLPSDLGLDRFPSLEPLGAVLGQAAGEEP